MQQKASSVINNSQYFDFFRCKFQKHCRNEQKQQSISCSYPRVNMLYQRREKIVLRPIWLISIYSAKQQSNSRQFSVFEYFDFKNIEKISSFCKIFQNLQSDTLNIMHLLILPLLFNAIASALNCFLDLDLPSLLHPCIVLRLSMRSPCLELCQILLIRYQGKGPSLFLSSGMQVSPFLTLLLSLAFL